MMNYKGGHFISSHMLHVKLVNKSNMCCCKICNNIVYLQIMSITLIMVVIVLENILDFTVQILLL